MPSLLGLLNIFGARRKKRRNKPSSYLSRKKGAKDVRHLPRPEFMVVGRRSDGVYRINSRCGVQRKGKGGIWRNVSLKSIAKDHYDTVAAERLVCRRERRMDYVRKPSLRKGRKSARVSVTAAPKRRSPSKRIRRKPARFEF